MASDLKLTAEQLAELESIHKALDERCIGEGQCCFCGEDYLTSSSRGDMEDVGYCWTCATEKMEAIGPMLPALIAAAKRLVHRDQQWMDGINEACGTTIRFDPLDWETHERHRQIMGLLPIVRQASPAGVDAQRHLLRLPLRPLRMGARWRSAAFDS